MSMKMGLLPDKNLKCSVLAEEKLDEISGRLEHSPCRSLRCLAKATGFRIISMNCRYMILQTEGLFAFLDSSVDLRWWHEVSSAVIRVSFVFIFTRHIQMKPIRGTAVVAQMMRLCIWLYKHRQTFVQNSTIDWVSSSCRQLYSAA
jgi:hypothetical protein